jgi:polysaccharide biosynthesis/export protein
MAKTGPGPSLAGRVCLAAAMLASLGACAGSGGLQTANVAEVNRDLPASYRVAAGDKLKVTVFDEPNLTGDYLVGMSGDLAMPLIGSIDARNMQDSDLANAISAKLKEGGYVLSPRVSIEILSHRPVYILGEVNKPGEYPHDAGMSLEQAVAKAGGYTRRADKKSVVLKRSDWTASRRVDLRGSALQIAPGDTITVSESFF